MDNETASGAWKSGVWNREVSFVWEATYEATLANGTEMSDVRTWYRIE